MSESPIIYISKRCEYCIELIKILNQRNDIKGNFSIISIDEEPFPNYIKEVPSMVSGDELYSAKEIFSMLDESNTTKSDPSKQTSEGSQSCSIDGYCKGDTCLSFSSIDGNGADSTLDTYYSPVESGDNNNCSILPNEDTGNPRDQRTQQFDSDYEKMMKERGEFNAGGGGGNQPGINFNVR